VSVGITSSKVIERCGGPRHDVAEIGVLRVRRYQLAP
jgi:hypothetical protein